LILQETLLAEPVLGDVQHPPIGAHRHPFGAGIAGGTGDVLKLEGHHGDRLGEIPHRIQVLIRGVEGPVGHRCRWRVALRAEDMDPVTEPPGGDGEHPSQLAASQNPERGPRGNDSLVS
jgi:hypothetical protein